jgi:hypothetical protein
VVGKKEENSNKPGGSISTGKNTPLKKVDKVEKIQPIGLPFLKANVMPAEINPIPDKDKISNMITNIAGSIFGEISIPKRNLIESNINAD